MRLHHHLIRHPSGVWYFRQSVSPDLRKLFGVRVFKKSLRTHDPTAARVCAYALGAQYAQLIAKARMGVGMGSQFEDYLKEFSRFELTQGPDGLSVKTNGTYEDNVAAARKGHPWRRHRPARCQGDPVTVEIAKTPPP